MDLPSDIFVKEEHDIEEAYYHESGDPFQFNIEIKTEELNYDWCMESQLRTLQEPILFGKTIPFNDLKDCMKQECSSCFLIFQDSFSLLQHNLSHFHVKLPALYECDECAKVFTNKLNLKSHVAVHKVPRPKTDKIEKTLHKCDVCSKILTYTAWWEHIRTVHSNIRSHQCTLCSSTFKTVRQLRKHMRYVHNKERRPGSKNQIEINPEYKIACDQCPAVFYHTTVLKTHIRNCHSEPAVCTICNSVLKSMAYLRAHIKRVHYDDGKQHMCHCGKTFRSPRYLRIHIKNSHSKPVARQLE